MTKQDRDRHRALKHHVSRGQASPGQIREFERLDALANPGTPEPNDPFANVGAKLRARLRDSDIRDPEAAKALALHEFDSVGKRAR